MCLCKVHRGGGVRDAIQYIGDLKAQINEELPYQGALDQKQGALVIGSSPCARELSQQRELVSHLAKGFVVIIGQHVAPRVERVVM